MKVLGINETLDSDYGNIAKIKFYGNHKRMLNIAPRVYLFFKVNVEKFWSLRMKSRDNPPCVDKKKQLEVLHPEDVAQFLRKSVSWVYKHWKDLGGVKIGGSILFPNEETLYEHLFHRRKGVEVRLHPEETTVHRPMVSDEKRGKASRSKKKGGNSKPGDSSDNDGGGEDPNRHNLLGVD